MKSNEYFSLKFNEGLVHFVDQTLLPFKEEIQTTENYQEIAEAIKCLAIRGAPLIGIAAAYAVALSQKKGYSQERYNQAEKTLAESRPTAVNLFHALKLMRKVFDSLTEGHNQTDAYNLLISKAIEYHNLDSLMCDTLAEHGTAIFTKPSVVLTHCNTGKYATGGIGTALGVIRRGYEKGLVKHVYVDETRPLLQGARLTAFELMKLQIPFTLITDSMAAHTIREKGVDVVITGADRIANNGDSANKIGTYSLAINAHFHRVPFYIAAPSSTFDTDLADGSSIPIEIRSQSEITAINQNPVTISNITSYNPSFDVTPSSIITGIITEKGIYYAPYNLSIG